MPVAVTHYRVFIASPSGLSEERKAFRDTISRFNARDGSLRRIYFDAVGWEMTLGQQGRPQAIINEEVRTCDYFFLVLHDRWGTPPGVGNFTSGTEEEFSVALQCLADKAMPMQQIVIAFKSVSERQLADPGPELSKVLLFRKELEREKKFLYQTFDDLSVFIETLDRHLAQWVRASEIGPINGNPPQSQETIIPEMASMHPTTGFDPAKRAPDILDSINAAEALVRQGHVVEAELAFSTIIAKFDDCLALAKFGRFLRKTGNRHRATETLTRGLELARQVGDKVTEAYITRQLGRLREVNGDTTGAIAQYGSTLAILSTIPDQKKNEVRTLRDLALAHRKVGNGARSIEYLERAKEIAEEIGDENSVAATLGYLGVIHKSQGNFIEARKVNEQAITIQSNRNDQRGLAAARSNLAIIYRMMGRLDEAQALHEQSLSIYRQQHERQAESRELSNLGTLQRVRGNFDNALDLHLKALAIAEQLQNKHGIAIQFGNLARDYMELGRLDEAERLHIDALNLSRSIDDIEGRAWQAEGIAQIQRARGNLSQALSYLENAQSDFRRINSKYGEAVCQYWAGQVLVQFGRLAEGKANVERANEFFKQQGIEPPRIPGEAPDSSHSPQDVDAS